MADDLQLHVRVTNRSIIRASDTSRKPYNLSPSNYDCFPGPFPAYAHFLYPNTAGAAFADVVATAKRTLPALLNYYFPFAGRLTADPATGAPIIACTNEGAELVEARADAPLSRIDFCHVDKSLDRIIVPFAADLCLSVQLVSYPCGGFSVMWGTNHLLVDAYSQLRFASLWAELARTGHVSWIPNHDRSLFKPRSPLRYGHIEKNFRTATPDDMLNVMAADVFVRRLYYVEAEDLDRLRAGAADEGGRRATRNEAFSAYLWKLLAGVVGEGDTSCRMGWLVDGRARMGGAVGRAMPDYVGNVISFASGEASVEELTKGSLAEVAQRVAEAVGEAAREEYFLEMNDWLEATKGMIRLAKVQVGVGSPAVVVSSCVNVGVEMDFGFGKPALVMPQISWGRLGSCFLVVARSPKGDGSWILCAYVWPKLAAALDADPRRVFRPLTAEHLGFVGPAAAANVEIVSRL